MILFVIICVVVLSSLCWRPRPYYGGWFGRPMFYHHNHHRPMNGPMDRFGGGRPPMGGRGPGMGPRW